MFISDYKSLSSCAEDNGVYTYEEKGNKKLLSNYPGYLPVSQLANKKFISITLKKGQLSSPLKGGEIGFTISENTPTRKLISRVQQNIKGAQHNALAIHPFIVTSVEDKKKIRIAEASGQEGLKENFLDLENCEEDEEKTFFRCLDPFLRNSLVETSLLNVNLLPISNFFDKPELYEHELWTHDKNNNLYSMWNCALAATHSSKKGDSSSYPLSETADIILGHPFTNHSKFSSERKDFMCSSFIILCYQTSVLQNILPVEAMPKLKTQTPAEIKQYYEELLFHDVIKAKGLEEDPLMQLDYRYTTPAELKTTLDLLSD